MCVQADVVPMYMSICYHAGTPAQQQAHCDYTVAKLLKLPVEGLLSALHSYCTALPLVYILQLITHTPFCTIDLRVMFCGPLLVTDPTLAKAM